MQLIGGNSKDFSNLIMFRRVAALVFLFLIWQSFPHFKSVAEIIWGRCEQNTVRKLQKIE